MYVTKYALQNGIECAEIIEKCNMTDDYTRKTRLLYLCEGRDGKKFFCEPEFIFDDLEEAREKAENMRSEKIKKLNGEIQRIKGIVF